MKALNWLFRDRATGEIIIGQFPNTSLALVLLLWAARVVFPASDATRTVRNIAESGAVLWWAGDELVRGVNPWRRFIGAGASGFLIVRAVASGRIAGIDLLG